MQLFESSLVVPEATGANCNASERQHALCFLFEKSLLYALYLMQASECYQGIVDFVGKETHERSEFFEDDRHTAHHAGMCHMPHLPDQPSVFRIHLDVKQV